MAETYKHVFQSAKADVGDATLVRPSNWNAEHRAGILLTNKSGAQQIAGVVAVLDSSNNDAFTLTAQQGSKGIPVVVMETIADNATGLVKISGHVTVNVQGAVSRGNLLRFSATSGSLENAGNMDRNPDHIVGMATSAFAGPGAGTVTAWMFGSNRQTAPTGSILIFPQPSTNVPFGWLLCDGTAVSRTTYADLFDRIGTTFGTGDGSTTFNLPNFKSRFPVGLDAGDATWDTIGETGGSKTKTLVSGNIPAHTHDLSNHTHSTPAHQHSMTFGTDVSAGSNPTAVSSLGAPVAANTDTSGAGTSGTPSNNTSGSTGSGTAFDVVNPFITMNFIIKW